MKKVILLFIVMTVLTACNVRYDKPFYYAYVQKQSDGTVVKSDSVSSKGAPSYTDKALQVANGVLAYKDVKEVAVFYSKGDVIVGYSLKNDHVEGTTNDNVDRNVPGTTKEQVERNVPGTVNDNVGRNGTGTTNNNVDRNVPGTVNDNVNRNRTDTTNDNVTPNVPGTINDNVTPNVPGTTNDNVESKVPSTTDGMTTPPNELALKQSIIQTVRNNVGDGTIKVHVAEKKEFEKAFRNFTDEMKGMSRAQIQERMQEIVNYLNR